MRLSSIFKFSLLALPTLLLNNVFGVKVSSNAVLGTPANDFTAAMDNVFTEVDESFNQNFNYLTLNLKMSKFLAEAEDVVDKICNHFENKEECTTAVKKYVDLCKNGACFVLGDEKYHTSPEIVISLFNRHQVAAAFYVFRHCGIYERSYFKRKFKKLFKREGKGYSSYNTLINALMFSNTIGDSTTSITETLLTFYLNTATQLYATFIYRDAKFASFANKFDKFNLLLIKIKWHLKNMLKNALSISEVPLCKEYFESLLEGYGDYLAGFDSSLTPLATRFSAVTAKAFKEVAYKEGTCPLRNYKQDLSRAGTALRDAGIRAGNALRNAGATISKRTTGALRGIHRRLTEASDKIRNRFRSRNGNGDDGSSDGLLDEDATVEATDDVKPEDDSTGDNEPKEDEITRL
ncbi:Rhoptry-associated protein 1 [Babesia duncani]|uniref:Rhoptry-associated protein 1 n=1 Tax=Babesia duncani TaxID=323732 RepID=A0AAD9PJW6_9APIC|nr:Rhoptry-associated protein 1 [Babesia duncani]